jgi:uridine kinase
MNNIECYLSYIQEINYIFSDDNKIYNFDKWINKQNNILFIVGLSGSGKTQLGRKLAEKYNVEYIQLDDIDRQFRKKLNNDKIQWDKETNQKVHDYLKQFLISFEKRAVIEGIHILYQDFELFKNKSLIIMSTSVLLSTIRAYNRNVEKYKDRASRFEIFKDIYVNQKDFIHRLKKFEEFMKKSSEGKNENF